MLHLIDSFVKAFFIKRNEKENFYIQIFTTSFYQPNPKSNQLIYKKKTFVVLILLTFYHMSQLLGDILLDRSNSAVMIKYVSSLDNMRILMNLLRVLSLSLCLFWNEFYAIFFITSNPVHEFAGLKQKYTV